MTAMIHTEPRTCEECGATYTRRRKESAAAFNRRRCCSNACRQIVASKLSAEANAKRTAAMIEDCEWIIDTQAPEDVARRLGYANAKSLERVLTRAGRYDLAAKLRRSEQVAA